MSELQPVIIQSDGDYVRSRFGELYLKEEVDHYISELIADQQLELDEWYCKVEHQKYTSGAWRWRGGVKLVLNFNTTMQCNLIIHSTSNVRSG